MKNTLGHSLLLILLINPLLGWSQKLFNSDSLINVLKTEKDDSTKLKTLNQLSACFLLSEPDKSHDYSIQMLALAQKLNSKEFIIAGYQKIGGYYYYKNDYKLVGEYCQKALEVIQQTSDKRALYKAYNNQSLLAIRQYDYPAAINYSDKALQIAEELRDSSCIALALSNRSIIYTNMSDFPVALNYLLKALAINEKIKNKSNMANNYFHIGNVYVDKADTQKALNYLLLSLTTAKEVNNRFQITQTLVKIGEVYKKEKNFTKALDYFNQAIVIGNEIGKPDDIICSTQDIAMILSEQGKYNEAIRLMLSAIKLSYNDEDKLLKGNNFACLGEIYLKKKEYKNAIAYLKKCLVIFKEVKSKENEATELENLATCYGAINNLKQQVNCLLQYQEVNDSIVNDETIRKTAEIETKYHLDKKESEIAILTAGRKLQQIEINKQTLLRNSFLAVAVLLLVLSFFIYRSYRTRQLLKLQRLRTKIASDLHDDIGSTLSSIAIFSEVAQADSDEVSPLLEQIGDYSRKMLDSMADIVWTISPDNDSFEKIIFRMRSFAYELLRAKKIDFKFQVDESVSDLKLSMEIRRNLYFIFKEATNNLAKYACADTVSFSLKNSNHHLTMIIRDNGKGFDLSREVFGNGLNNMKIRAQDIGAKLFIESKAEEGTIIQVLIKTA